MICHSCSPCSPKVYELIRISNELFSRALLPGRSAGNYCRNDVFVIAVNIYTLGNDGRYGAGDSVGQKRVKMRLLEYEMWNILETSWLLGFLVFLSFESF